MTEGIIKRKGGELLSKREDTEQFRGRDTASRFHFVGACVAGEAARYTGGETRLNFGEAASGPIGGNKGTAGYSGGVFAARAPPLEGLRPGPGTWKLDEGGEPRVTQGTRDTSRRHRAARYFA